MVLGPVVFVIQEGHCDRSNPERFYCWAVLVLNYPCLICTRGTQNERIICFICSSAYLAPSNKVKGDVGTRPCPLQVWLFGCQSPIRRLGRRLSGVLELLKMKPARPLVLFSAAIGKAPKDHLGWDLVGFECGRFKRGLSSSH